MHKNFRTQENHRFSVYRKFTKFSGKSQAALEFLMTYGWAILVVLVAIGALAYFGVLSPDKFLPSKCTLPAGIACTDFKVTTGATLITGTVDIVLRNGMGFDATSVEVGVEGCTAKDNTPSTIANGAQEQYTATGCTVTSGSKYSGDINVTYQNADTGLTHNVQGSITARGE
ncbi:hypothetical protein HYU09_05075 [Candidatus Woesearchaeota archaeon]|nr:hypothetical protein [Candidatus Woesearchaeota archaeon]